MGESPIAPDAELKAHKGPNLIRSPHTVKSGLQGCRCGDESVCS